MNGIGDTNQSRTWRPLSSSSANAKPACGCPGSTWPNARRHVAYEGAIAQLGKGAMTMICVAICRPVREHAVCGCHGWHACRRGSRSPRAAEAHGSRATTLGASPASREPLAREVQSPGPRSLRSCYPRRTPRWPGTSPSRSRSSDPGSAARSPGPLTRTQLALSWSVVGGSTGTRDTTVRPSSSAISTSRWNGAMMTGNLLARPGRRCSRCCVAPSCETWWRW